MPERTFSRKTGDGEELPSSILTAEGGGLPPGRPLPTAPGGIAKPSRVLRAYPMLTRRAPGLG